MTVHSDIQIGVAPNIRLKKRPRPWRMSVTGRGLNYLGIYNGSSLN